MAQQAPGSLLRSLAQAAARAAQAAGGGATSSGRAAEASGRLAKAVGRDMLPATGLPGAQPFPRTLRHWLQVR